MTRTLTILAAIAATAALAVSSETASAATSTKPPTQATLTYTLNNTMISSYSLSTRPANGIIMRDGGVCDPIRHMGC